jgi:hypothetical protein
MKKHKSIAPNPVTNVPLMGIHVRWLILWKKPGSSPSRAIASRILGCKKMGTERISKTSYIMIKNLHHAYKKSGKNDLIEFKNLRNTYHK